MEQETKIYYLPPFRSIIIGIILLLMGLGLTFGMVDLNLSVWQNLQQMFISFEGVAEFLFSLLMLFFKAGFIAGGYAYIKYSAGVERAKLDNKGLYYREIPKGSRLGKISIDLGKLTLAPYAAIKDISCEKSFWAGWQLYLTLATGRFPLTALGVLKLSEKREIVDLVKQRIKSNK